MSEVLSIEDYRRPVRPERRGRTGKQSIFFNRFELDRILQVYSQMVMLGEWRDYAIGKTDDSATFAVFKRTADFPAYRIVKQPKLARRQGAFAVVAAGGRILKRGHDLAQVLRIFDKKRVRLIEAGGD